MYTHSPLQKKLSPQSQCGEVLLHGLQWWFGDRDTEWRIEARQRRSSKGDPPRKGCESVSVGVGTCAMLLCYFKVLCPSPLSHWIHVTTPGCVKGFFKSPRPPVPPPSPSVSDSCRQLIEIMADSCETKHSFSAVCDIKEGSWFSPFFQSSFSFTAWVIVSGSMSWLHVEGWCIDHRQSFDSGVHQNTENYCSRVNGHGLSPAHKGHSFISCPHTGNASPFLSCQCFGALKITW